MEPNSSDSTNWKYDVFLSFRGEDTRCNFVSHLYEALNTKGIITFKDDKELERGKSIAHSLLEAIENSKIALVVLSQNYAFSPWCLNELIEIVKCRQTKNQVVLPIFLKVDPSDIEKQARVLTKAFEEHELNFKNDRIQAWKDALSTVVTIAGWDSRKCFDGSEAALIKCVVRDVSDKLICVGSCFENELVGMDCHMMEIDKLISIECNDVRMVGIWGREGIGKTAIADFIYHRDFSKFEACCRLKNVKEKHKKDGLIVLQKELMSRILSESYISICDIDSGCDVIRKRFRSKKVLIVLDDIDELEQLKILANDILWFGQGSRIFITTRDERLLILHRVKHIYKVPVLKEDQDLQLFSLHAFEKNQPPNEFLDLSKRFVSCAHGLPLTLKALGTSLRGRDIDFWHCEFEKVKRIPDADMYRVLKISFDGLDALSKSSRLCDPNDAYSVMAKAKGFEKREFSGVVDALSSRYTSVHCCCELWNKMDQRLTILEFDRDRKSMGGAVENLLERSNSVQLLDGCAVELNQYSRKLILEWLNNISESALRCLEVVAMTGDGVNDAPALKFSDIGIAMSFAGTEVAREGFDMVLADDNFSTIAAAVGDGRCMYHTLIRYMISSKICEVASIFLHVALGLPEGMVTVQLLWVNLVIHGALATALGFNPPYNDIMKKPPRRSDDSLITAWILFRQLVIGLYVGIATVGTFIVWYTHNDFMGIDFSGDGHSLVTYSQLAGWDQCETWKNFSVSSFVAGSQVFIFDGSPCEYFNFGKIKASALFLSVLVVIEIFNSLNALSKDGSLLTVPPWVNPYLLLAMSVSFGFHLLILYVPFLAQVFGVVPLSLNEWLLVLNVSFPVILIDEVLKFIGRCR